MKLAAALLGATAAVTGAVVLATSGSPMTLAVGESFQTALTAASCGQSIHVPAGTYGGQTLTTGQACTPDSPVSFVADGPVTLTGGLNVKASNVSFTGPFAFDGTYTVEQGASYVTFDGVSAPHAFILGSHVTIKGGSIGPNNTCQTGLEDGLQIWDAGSVSATYVTVDGVRFHDVTDNGNQCAGTSHAGTHVDCVQLLGASNVTIENSTFDDCATSGIIGRPYTTPLHDVLIVNNYFGKIVTPGASINIGNSSDACTNVVVAYNTVTTAWPNLTCGAGGTGNLVYGNIFPGYYQQAGFASSYNVAAATGTYGAGSKRCAPVFADGFHLAATDTCARGAGDPASFPTADVDGDPRGVPPDAGADQYTAIAPPATTTATTTQAATTATTVATTTATVPAPPPPTPARVTATLAGVNATKLQAALAAHGSPIVITSNGKPVAVVTSP